MEAVGPRRPRGPVGPRGPVEPVGKFVQIFFGRIEGREIALEISLYLNSRQIKKDSLNLMIIIRIEKKMRTKTRHLTLIFSELDFRTLLCQNEKNSGVVYVLFAFCTTQKG